MPASESVYLPRGWASFGRVLVVHASGPGGLVGYAGKPLAQALCFVHLRGRKQHPFGHSFLWGLRRAINDELFAQFASFRNGCFVLFGSGRHCVCATGRPFASSAASSTTRAKRSGAKSAFGAPTYTNIRECCNARCGTGFTGTRGRLGERED